MLKTDTSDAYLPAYMAKFRNSGRWAARWHKRALPGKTRTPAALDSDVNVTLPRQWALLQPAARLDSQMRITVPAHASMAWSSNFAPGVCGVRLLVVTLLNWGANTVGSQDEQREWCSVAADVAQVLRILAQQAGGPQSSAAEVRKKYAARYRARIDFLSDHVVIGCQASNCETRIGLHSFDGVNAVDVHYESMITFECSSCPSWFRARVKKSGRGRKLVQHLQTCPAPPRARANASNYLYTRLAGLSSYL